MTKGEFEAGYAERSGLTVAQLQEFGMYPVQCDCGEEGCKGWQMKSQPEKTEMAKTEGDDH